MSTTTRLRCALMLFLMVSLPMAAMAFPRYAMMTKMSCATCHANPAGGPDLTDAGKAYKADSTKVPAKSVEGASYVSSRKCRSCHIAEYKSWTTTPHAGALDTLKMGSAAAIASMSERLGVKLSGPADKNEMCVSCHTTGYGLDGGYPALGTTPAAADSAKVAAHASVSCEACHGPGSKHIVAEKAAKKSVINTKVEEGTCRGCHTPATNPKFDFAAYKVKGVHAIAKSD